MNREAIEKRIEELRASLRQIENNGNAMIGAIEECERWLKIAKREEIEKEEKAVQDG